MGGGFDEGQAPGRPVRRAFDRRQGEILRGCPSDAAHEGEVWTPGPLLPLDAKRFEGAPEAVHDVQTRGRYLRRQADHDPRL
jgi:hypothetical protein